VKRPGIFEMKPGESFSDLLSFASGFTSLPIQPVSNFRKPLKNSKCRILSAEFKSYKPLSGDVFRVTKILNRFENRIRIDGPFSDLIPISFMKACAF
jgi:protein involved in polysaccharide export with SLBB domain